MLLHTLITYVFSVVPRLLPYSMANLNLPLHTPRIIVTVLDMLTTSTPSVGTGGSFGGACWHNCKLNAYRPTSMQDRNENTGPHTTKNSRHRHTTDSLPAALEQEKLKLVLVRPSVCS